VSRSRSGPRCGPCAGLSKACEDAALLSAIEQARVSAVTV
jgi:hypothetical protein